MKIQGVTKAMGITSKYRMLLFLFLFVGCGAPEKYTRRNRTRYTIPSPTRKNARRRPDLSSVSTPHHNRQPTSSYQQPTHLDRSTSNGTNHNIGNWQSSRCCQYMHGNKPYQADARTNSSENKSDNVRQQAEDQDCPICCSENALTDHGCIRCNACKKRICQTCYKNIENAHNTENTYIYDNTPGGTSTFRTKKRCPFCQNENF